MIHRNAWFSRASSAAHSPALVPIAWLCLLASACSAPASDDKAPWVLVDTAATTLTVMQDQRALARFTNISIGREGSSRHRRKGENKTPLGVYRISWVEKHSPFHRFYGLNYPTVFQAYWARTQGIIDEATYQRILRARRDRRRPPQNTPLGGHIGIHGLGDADPWIHAHVHWTNGCIALTDEQIEQLSQWIGNGTRVIIR